MSADPFSRRVSATAKDLNGELIKGVDFNWFVNGESAGTGKTSEGHSTIEVLDANAVISVSAVFGGTTKGPVVLANDQTLYSFIFETTIHSSREQFAMKHFPAIIGIVFILLAVVLVFVFGKPTALQTHVVLALFALGGGGFGGEIAGFLNVNLTLTQKLTISAGGAAAIFVLLYFFVPAGAQ